MPKKRRRPAQPKRVSRALELARLDELQQAFYARALKGDIEAPEICIDIIARRARLLGLTRAIKRGSVRSKARSVASTMHRASFPEVLKARRPATLTACSRATFSAFAL